MAMGSTSLHGRTLPRVMEWHQARPHHQKNLEDFVDPSAGNAVFVVDVLVGDPEMVTQPTRGRLPKGKDSRVVNKATGIDELVVFEESQALPIALIVFRS